MKSYNNISVGNLHDKFPEISPNQPYKNDPFKKEEGDNDATRIRPGVNEPDKIDPTKIDVPPPAIPTPGTPQPNPLPGPGLNKSLII